LDHFDFLVAELYAQLRPLRRDAQVAVTEPANEVKRLSRSLLVCEPERVVRDVARHRLAHLRSSFEIAVRRDHRLDALVQTVEVVRVDVQRQPPLAVGEIAEDRPRQKFLPQRLPESLHLPERLRMLRPALDVLDSVAAQLFLESRLPAPGRVLPPVVRQ
jgi:hypothetical protein